MPLISILFFWITRAVSLCAIFLIPLAVILLEDERSGWNDLKFVCLLLLERGYSSEDVCRILSLYILENGE